MANRNIKTDQRALLHRSFGIRPDNTRLDIQTLNY